MASIVDERGYNQSFRPSPAQIFRLKRRTEAIVRELHLSNSHDGRQRLHILEIGCATGEMSYQLAELTGARVTGVDLSEQFIRQAQSTHHHPNLSFAVVDLSKEFPSSDTDRYDYIVGNGILHHLYFHLDSFLPVLSRWLAPGGRIIFWEPNFWNPYIFLIFSVPPLRRLSKLEPDEMAFTAKFITKKLSSAGFDLIHVSTRDFLLPNTPAFLVKLAVLLGGWAEKVPILCRLAQSVFVVATRPASPQKQSE